MFEARALLRRARETVHDVRGRLPGVIDETNWRSPSVRAFRVAIEEWASTLDQIVEQLARWDDELARALAAREAAPPSGRDLARDETLGDGHVFGGGWRG